MKRKNADYEAFFNSYIKEIKNNEELTLDKKLFKIEHFKLDLEKIIDNTKSEMLNDEIKRLEGLNNEINKLQNSKLEIEKNVSFLRERIEDYKAQKQNLKYSKKKETKREDKLPIIEEKGDIYLSRDLLAKVCGITVANVSATFGAVKKQGMYSFFSLKNVISHYLPHKNGSIAKKRFDNIRKAGYGNLVDEIIKNEYKETKRPYKKSQRVHKENIITNDSHLPPGSGRTINEVMDEIEGHKKKSKKQETHEIREEGYIEESTFVPMFKINVKRLIELRESNKIPYKKSGNKVVYNIEEVKKSMISYEELTKYLDIDAMRLGKYLDSGKISQPIEISKTLYFLRNEAEELKEDKDGRAS